MSEREESADGETRIARVAKVLEDPTKLVINKGSADGVKRDQRFLVYALSDDDIIDPVKGDNLGRLEIVRGTGRAVHVQERMTTIQSDRKGKGRTIRRNSPFSRVALGLASYEEVIVPEDPIPFEEPQCGDRVKPL